jgi:hypothetical protein
MNGAPPPADLSKLKGILGNAKSIINKVNDGNYETGNIDSNALVQSTDGYVSQGNVSTDNQAATMGNATRSMGQPNKNTIINSKMPEAIKKAMLENPISQPKMNHTFNLDDVSDLIDEKPITTQTPKNRVNESVIKGDMITISESSLKDMIKDVLIEYLSGDYSKNITEGVIKKTINTLIKEGKIKTKTTK